MPAFESISDPAEVQDSKKQDEMDFDTGVE